MRGRVSPRNVMTTLTMPRRLMRPVATRPARRSTAIGLVAGLAAGILLLIAASIAIGMMNEDRVMPGVSVAGVDVGGLGPAEAEARLAAELPSLSIGTATVVVDEIEHVVSFEDLGRRYELDATVADAMGVARDGNPLAAGIARLRTLVHPTTVGVSVHPFDNAAVDRVATTLSELAEIAPVDATVVANGAEFDATRSQDGRALSPEAVRSALAAQLETADPANVRIRLEPTSVAPQVTSSEAWRASLLAERTARPMRLTVPGAEGDEDLASLALAPATIAAWITFEPADEGGLTVQIDDSAVAASVAGLAEVIDQEAVNARFSVAGGGLGGVIAGQTGRHLLVDESAQAVLAALEGRATGAWAGSVALNVTVDAPALTTAQAEAALPQMRMVSTWTTNYVSGPSNGFSANISIPAWDLDGYTLAPGQWFSFWEGIGPVTRERGYTDGGVILNGRSQPTGALAGGICSTSTTLFNAAMRFGLEIGDRAAHYYYIDRYPLGLDATVSIIDGWVQDMTFRNDTEHPIVIRGFGSPGQVTFQLWSVPNGRTVALSPASTWDHVAAGDSSRVDPSMAPGTSRRIESPINGFKSSVSRVVRDANGNVLHENTWYSDYHAVTGIVVTGPSGSAEAPPADSGTAGTGGTATTPAGGVAP
jgi:vancomycin resistance protein YoaR